MTDIATLTLNPTLDVAFEVERIFPTHKVRGGSERHDPGGGGINVARVFCRLGGNARCYYLAGGAAGAALDWLLDQHQLVRTRIAIAGETRVSSSVFERESGREYRFVTDGPSVTPAEWETCEALLAEAQCEFLVASGSLPPGVPTDAYARLARIAKERGIRFVLDTSGEGLAEGLAGGDVFLVKPSVGELRKLTGLALDNDADIADAALEIVGRGQAQLVAVTMGRDGALLADASGAVRLPPIPVRTASAVGAGDSFLAGMVYALGLGESPLEALRLGQAAGAAAVLTPGTDLARASDIRRLHAQAAEGEAPTGAPLHE